jgi:HEAT repeat protein
MTLFRNIKTGLILGLGALSVAAASSAQSDDARDPRTLSGRALSYDNLDESSLEQVSTPDHILAVTRPNVAPMEVWRALEHGEKIECLDCIPEVSKLLYNEHPRTREIAAWWLRRRIFGVFGPGEVYSRVIDTLNDSDVSAARRAVAAEALGEFLSLAGEPHLARAATEDDSPEVRLSAVNALRRMNRQGPNGELSLAMADSSEEVRLAAIEAATKVNGFSGLDSLVERIGDDSDSVRIRSAEVLGELRAGDSVMALVALTWADRESNPEVRLAAVAALGQIGDPEARDAVQDVLDNDPDQHVQQAARIALRRL